jgi:hypothetical protein
MRARCGILARLRSHSDRRLGERSLPTFPVTQYDVQIGLASAVSLVIIPYGWSTWGLCWSLREILIVSAPSRGDYYVMLNPVRDKRRKRTFTPTRS